MPRTAQTGGICIPGGSRALQPPPDAAHPEINVRVVTMFDDSASVLAAVRAGARGYLLKGADRKEILRAVHPAAAGEASIRGAAMRT